MNFYLLLDLPMWASVVNLVFYILTLVFFTIAACTQPGYITNNKVNFMDMLNVVENTQLCADCETIRTSRSRHCSVCGYCVERFDHHCPWINNCVGVRNHNAFLAYLTFQTLVVVTTLAESVFALFNYLRTNSKHFYRRNPHFFDYLPDTLENEIVVVFFLSALICLTLLFTPPLLTLYSVQVTNFMNGKTTMERHGRAANETDRESRIRNSGIIADMQVYLNAEMKAARLHGGAAVSSSFQLMQQNDVSTADLDEDENREERYQRLISPKNKTVNELALDLSYKLRSKNLNPREKRKKLKQRDRQLTELAQN